MAKIYKAIEIIFQLFLFIYFSVSRTAYRSYVHAVYALSVILGRYNRVWILGVRMRVCTLYIQKLNINDLYLRVLNTVARFDL